MRPGNVCLPLFTVVFLGPKRGPDTGTKTLKHLLEKDFIENAQQRCSKYSMNKKEDKAPVCVRG